MPVCAVSQRAAYGAPRFGGWRARKNHTIQAYQTPRPKLCYETGAANPARSVPIFKFRVCGRVAMACSVNENTFACVPPLYLLSAARKQLR